MSTDELKLSSAMVLKLREYNFTNDEMISFALSLGKHLDVNRLSQLMMGEEPISFNYNVETRTFELIDSFGLMGDNNSNIIIKV